MIIDISLNDTLMALGIKEAFNAEKADLSGICADTPLFISNVIHKTHIDLDSEGTRAAAVTAVMVAEATAMIEEWKEVYLDRPFVYMIVDSTTNLPIFMGTVTDFGR